MDAKLSLDALTAVAERTGSNVDEYTQSDLDVLNCEYTEYPTATAACEDLGWDCDSEEDALAILMEETYCIPFDGGVVLYI